MVVGAFPAFKLGSLLLKQISKPVASFVKERAKNNYFFRTYICMPPAQFYNWCEVKAKMWSLNLGKPVVVPKLNEAMAIELGANLLGEAIVFTTGAGLLIFEYARGVRKEQAKEEAHLSEMNQLHVDIQDLYFMTEQQRAQITELQRALGHAGSHIKSHHHHHHHHDPPEPNTAPPPAQCDGRIKTALTDLQKKLSPS